MVRVAKDFRFKINDLVINQGSEFIVAIAGEMMRMPGLLLIHRPDGLIS